MYNNLTTAQMQMLIMLRAAQIVILCAAFVLFGM